MIHIYSMDENKNYKKEGKTTHEGSRGFTLLDGDALSFGSDYSAQPLLKGERAVFIRTGRLYPIW